MQQSNFYAVCLFAIFSCTVQQEINDLYCPSISQPVNGQIIGKCSGGKPGDKCTFSCNPDYLIFGQTILTCTNGGRWDSNPSSCRQDNKFHCPALNVPSNGQNSGMCWESKPGSTCSFYCNPGFAIVGISNLACGQDGKWSAMTPFCQQQNQGSQPTANNYHCRALSTPSNGQNSGMCLESRPGSTCSFYCNQGFAIQGSANLTCGQDGKWSSAAPYCQQQNYQPSQNRKRKCSNRRILKGLKEY